MVAAAALLVNAAFFKIDHSHDHSAARIERQILEAPPAIEGADLTVDRMCHDAKAADFPRRPQCRPQSEKEQGASMSSALMILVDGKLPKKRDWQGVGLVALSRFGQKRAFDLRSA